MKHFKSLSLLFVMIMFFSCSSQYRYASLQGAGKTADIAFPSCETTGISERYFYSQDSNDEREYMAEKQQIFSLLQKIDNQIDVDKNKVLLEKEKNLLSQRCNERITSRLSFLHEFYVDINNLKKNDFDKKYKKHCSKNLLKGINILYKKMNIGNADGYAWIVFNNEQNTQDLSITHLNGQWQSLDKQLADFIYGADTIRINSYKYAYYNKEDKWYHVGMGDNNVLVKVEGEGKHIAITGVVNPILNVWIKTQYDR